MRNRSTIINLECVLTYDWIVGLACSNNIHVVLVEFSTAFHCIVFSKLLFKLQNCIIICELLAWLSSFLHGASKCVVLENCFLRKWCY